ncbi:MAG: sodium:alanine symporter family protein [Parvibaculum sp.]|jgi:AGCS family alanine or glycine:cation symporter|nr:sodium:alanine symporter family protein [Parvibaculum sp.]
MEMIEAFVGDINSTINSIVWGVPMLVLIGATGLFLTIGLRFLQFRHLVYAFKLLRQKESGAEGEVSPFKALMTALSATVGTGNIGGVALAIVVGGPGALFYMWLIALVGMATKYAEAVCAVTYREVDERGVYVGGPMYYLKNGVGAKFPLLGAVLAPAFAVFAALAGFGIGNGTQSNAVAGTMELGFGVPPEITGLVLAVIVGLVIIGGVKRIADVAGTLVPLMITLYLISAFAILAINYEAIPAAFSLIFKSAFTPAAAAGGVLGAGVAAAIEQGFKRGIFSNEAGLGSAAIAHAAAKTNNPVRQGHIAMLGVFIDTIIVCTMTGLVIITTGLFAEGNLTAAPLTSASFASVLPFGDKIVAVALAVFAFTTILGWSYYGERSVEYLFGIKAINPYRIVWVLAIPVGATIKLGLIWDVADTLNALMAIPNLIGLIILGPMVFRATKEYWANGGKAEEPQPLSAD